MIYFNGQGLESLIPVDIVDILPSPIQRNVITRSRPTASGAEFVRVTEGTRTVAITFALRTEDMKQRQLQLLEISKWARTKKEAPLQIPNYMSMELMCICTSLPEPSTRQWWESKLRLVFTAYNNPYFTRCEEKAAQCGNTVYIGGDAPPLMQIRHTFTSPASNVSYSDGTRTMTFSQIPAGELVIDLNKQTAAVNGVSIMENYTFGSHFVEPDCGQFQITGTGTIYFRERWY